VSSGLLHGSIGRWTVWGFYVLAYTYMPSTVAPDPETALAAHRVFTVIYIQKEKKKEKRRPASVNRRESSASCVPAVLSWKVGAAAQYSVRSMQLGPCGRDAPFRVCL
jgi:hypothetical protein